MTKLIQGFEIGETVIALKKQTVPMVVVEVNKGQITCAWTDENGTLKHRKFRHVELEKEKYMHPANIVTA
jgi:uncharacterized protein YodC (DUF2158 family)